MNKENIDEKNQYEEFYTAGLEKLEVYVPDGIDHYCFGCSSSNPIGLHLQFFSSPLNEDLKINKLKIQDEGNFREKKFSVYSKFKVKYDYCGFPRFSHGGILATLLDEVMAHAVYRGYGKYGVTKEMTIKYRKPVLIDQIIYIKGEVSVQYSSDEIKQKKVIEVHGNIYSTPNGFDDPKPKLHAEAFAEMVILPLERYILNYQEK
ncbi:MAG: PaaI family thioesterase [Candidatus Lokiarchaeota archaeon]|nr:PaaI family thioesterase [Candidatus Harpocratesius repetitus]